MTHIVPIVSILKLVKVLSFCPQFPDEVDSLKQAPLTIAKNNSA